MTRKILSSVTLLTLCIALIYAFTLPARIITGTVVDAAGEALIGANVLVKGTSTGTVTDLDGKFSLEIPEGNSVLVISYTGYETQEIRLKDQKTISVQMKESAEILSECVVVGYSAEKEDANSTPSIRIRGTSPSLNSEMQMSMPYQGKPANTSITNKNGILDIEEERAFHDPTSQEGYGQTIENPFQTPLDKPLSTFGVDVDRASYSNIRRFINYGQMPVADAVRIEEMINYFDYEYPKPSGVHPFSVNTELATAPWNSNHYIMKVGLQGQDIDTKDLPPSNLVFLIDVSGSMSSFNKLDWVKESFKLLQSQLRDVDRVSIVVYAGAAGTVLPPTKGTDKKTIYDALDKLESGGSTAGGAGIKLAYAHARKNFVEGGNNRVILATDGDFNVGVSHSKGLVKLIEKERESGIFLTVLGFGTGNYQDHKMQELADRGNGNHAYIDDLSEAKKVLVEEFGGTMFTIAKDVKIQIQFNEELVDAYRLIGYENRMLNAQDFEDDKKDAGEIGAGHRVTALYEIVPKGIQSQFTYKGKADDEIIEEDKLQKLDANDLALIKLRYKKPNGKKSIYLDTYLTKEVSDINHASENLRFASAVAEFGLLLRDSEYKQKSSYDQVLANAIGAKGSDRNGYRQEFIELVGKVKNLSKSIASK